MALPEQKKKLLKAKIAVALHDELGRVPKKEEIEQVFLMARVMYKAVLLKVYRLKRHTKSFCYIFTGLPFSIPFVRTLSSSDLCWLQGTPKTASEEG
jgi:hypothetical protein